MSHLLIGALVMATFMVVCNKINKKNIPVPIWKWIFLSACFIYCAFVLIVIAEFLAEPKVQAAVVIGGIFGVIAVIWAVIAARLISSSAKVQRTEDDSNLIKGGNDDVQSVDA